MLGGQSYTPEVLVHAAAAIDRQLTAYRNLRAAIDGDTAAPEVAAALHAFEPLFFNNMTLVLDRHFVHRLRAVAGKDGNPLNEVELLADSLINNDGVLRGNNVIKLAPERSVLQLGVGDRIGLGAAQFERLSSAFLAEVRSRFL